MDNNYDNQEEDEYVPKSSKQSNVLPLWGNERSMNLNPLILTNIQSSSYFKAVTLLEHHWTLNLYELKTYHEVIDEIYYKVNHLEPWEKGSRRTSGQTGMCGGVRGVGAGGIVSTAYCLLYKLFTLKLTRKQLNGLITHCDSPYIRALGFMYVRYTQPPNNLLDWYGPYLNDEEEMDVKAGGGQMMRIGTMLRQWLIKLEWFSTLFPRIPVPIQQKIQKHLDEHFPSHVVQNNVAGGNSSNNVERDDRKWERSKDFNRDRDWNEERTRDYLRDDRERDNGRDVHKRSERSGRDRERHSRDRRHRERSPYRERSPRGEHSKHSRHSSKDDDHKHKRKHR